MIARCLHIAGVFWLVTIFPANAVEILVKPGEGTLVRAIFAAAPGDKLVLSPGLYQGKVIIDRSLEIKGALGSEIIGDSAGSVITIDAADVTVSSLKISGSGSDHDTIDAGVKLTQKATNARVKNNQLFENLYGVDVHGARDAIVSGNTIEGRSGARMNERGNGIYVWNAPGTVIENNHIRLGRDGIFVNTSKKNVFRGNRMENLRFAIHYMYANDSVVEGNVSVGNHLGYALMFSSRLVVKNNVSTNDRDHGIMLNYANGSKISGNQVSGGGKKCLFMYNANKNILTGNTFSKCPIGIHFTAGSERNKIF
ncbi:MAG: nitrous oxide reductase family maturation protein NosD, partial [Hyphomicrobiales bacterium]